MTGPSRHLPRTPDDRRSAFYTCALASLFLLPGPLSAHAEQPALTWEITQNGIIDSNPLMVSTGDKTLYGSVTNPSVRLEQETPRAKMSVSGAVKENIYNDPAFNSTDLFASAGYKAKTERHTASLSGFAAYDTARSSEISTNGIAIARTRHTGLRLAPSWSYALSPIQLLSVSGEAYRSLYDGTAYTDYHQYGVTPSYAIRLSPTITTALLAQAQRYEAEENSKSCTDSVGPALNILFDLTERTSLTLQQGYQASHTYAESASEGWKWHSVYKAEIKHKGKKDSLTLGAARERQPYASGSDKLLTSLSISGTHAFNEALKLKTAASFKQADTANNSGSDMKNRTEAEIGLTYALWPDMNLAAAERYRAERLNGQKGQTEAFISILSLTYRPFQDETR